MRNMDGSRAWRAVLDEHVGNGIMRLVLFEIAFSFLILDETNGRKREVGGGRWKSELVPPTPHVQESDFSDFMRPFQKCRICAVHPIVM